MVLKKAYISTVGRRKTAVARIRLTKKGEGKFTVNNKPLEKYFPTANLQNLATQPLKIISLPEKPDISVKVSGGGIMSQADSVRLGIARALLEIDMAYKPKLKKAGLLTRDSRKKERKKPGLRRARRAPQWSKR
jgi:small subunit ribosomal protein S9